MQAWTRILHRQGWSAPHWPLEYGGTGWSPLRRHVFEEECALAGAPPTCTAAFSLVAPVIFTFGVEAQKRRHLPRILRGDEFWGQGFSEPNAGSDLASLRTAAVRRGDYYVVTGQKIWTTEAHYADMLFCLVRTHATPKPQQGISFLLIDAHAPGVTIRPIISIDGAHSLNEVFLDEVRVPAENLVGEEGKGWSYAKFLLENERAFSAEVPRNKRMFARLKAVASRERRHGRPLIEDPIFATRLAQARGRARCARVPYAARAERARRRGGASLAKRLRTAHPRLGTPAANRRAARPSARRLRSRVLCRSGR